MADALLEAHAISVNFGGVAALNGVDLSIPQRQITGLIGPNGAGKTTMFNILTGVIDADVGTVKFNGDDISRWPAHRRGRAGIARTFQRLELFARLSVRDNLLAAFEAATPGAVFGRARNRGRARVAEVLELLDLEQLAHRLAGELPTGQGRMVELGRALCTGPKLLLLDEPGSGLDGAETARFAKVLHQITYDQHIAVLLVEHDMSLVMDVCDQINVLEFGTRIAVGTPAQIQANDAVRAAYLGDVDVD